MKAPVVLFSLLIFLALVPYSLQNRAAAKVSLSSRSAVRSKKAQATAETTGYSCIYTCTAPTSSSSDSTCASSLITVAIDEEMTSEAEALAQCQSIDSTEYSVANDFCVNTRKKCAAPAASAALVTPNNT